METEPPVRHPDAPAPGTKLGQHYSRCFGCGDEQPGGLRLSATAGEGVSLVAEFEVTEAHEGAPGLAHGGLLACAFDEALGGANAMLRLPAVTGHLQTDFRRPVPVGTRLHITAQVDGVAGRKIYSSAAGRLNGPDGQLALHARALFVIVDVSHFTTHGNREQIAKLSWDQAARDEQLDFNP
ncbi:acyl-coenzyme A thioesterase PaaI-like protein [Tamaricihabitans halophyticus]|uniref:Acyl-coenzyme A thioesterase THEM4 n=1 Tax=Tamaricihabitans halophyticus TaxID=1262583 RepID=A0A4R2PWX7_9PSEU|nr:acyl-coenzyme A thioesterase PaaI-like protein [Tamaricihabitans halophyticus]